MDGTNMEEMNSTTTSNNDLIDELKAIASEALEELEVGIDPEKEEGPVTAAAEEFLDDDYEEEPTIYPAPEHLAYPGEEDFSLELDYMDDEKQEDKLWQARTGLDHDTLCGAIETIIFMNDKPVALAKIRNLIDPDLPLRVIHESLTRLQNEYEQKHHGIRLQEVAEGYQFRTKATYSKYVQDIFKVNSLVLSPTALEVLAILAYKQPCSKNEVEKIRGVDSSHIIRALMDKRLVKVVGRSDEVGRPALYGTTPEFLEVFNLANLDQLPPEHELEEMSKQDFGKIADIKKLVHTGDKKRFNFDEIDELDQLSDEIKKIDADTPFTKSLKVEEKKRKNESGETIKTAFELLEEHLDSQLIIDVNTTSGESEPFTAITAANVISDLTAGPFNVPEEEDEEDFQMIDLDTGLPIEDEPLENEEDDVIEFEADQELADLVESIDITDEVLGNEETLDEQAKELSAALDDAFEKLTGEKLDDEASEIESSLTDFEKLADTNEELVEQMVEKASDLDLDLDFLKEPSSNAQVLASEESESETESDSPKEIGDIDLSFLND